MKCVDRYAANDSAAYGCSFVGATYDTRHHGMHPRCDLATFVALLRRLPESRQIARLRTSMLDKIVMVER